VESTRQTAAGRDLLNTAGQDAVVHKTGTTVAHSVPVRGAANKPTSADRKSDASLCSADICSGNALTIHHHAKSGQGSGDGVPGGGEAAVVSSLDQIQTNRNKQLGRGKHCGRFTVRGQAPTSAELRFHRVNCKSWTCSYCGPRRAKRYKRAIREAAEELALQRLLTLTLDPAKIEGDPVQYLNRLFAMLRVYLGRKYGASIQYIRILEFQKNGNPHFHILIDRYIPREWIQAAWVAVGGGRMVDVRHVDVHRVSRYLSKYLTKELLMSAPSRSRRVTTSRGIKLFEKKPTEFKWELLRVSIYRLHEMYAVYVLTQSFDEDQLLESFTANLNGK
jgi:hypothetical protein